MENGNKPKTSDKIFGYSILFVLAASVIVPFGFLVLGFFQPNTVQQTTQQQVQPTAPLDNAQVTPSPSSYTEARGTDDCTSDCSGHEAGWEWAAEKEICDPEYDNGNSESFNEGVRAWAEENCAYSEDGYPI